MKKRAAAFFISSSFFVVITGCARPLAYRINPPAGPYGDGVFFMERVRPVAQTSFQCGPASLESVMRYWGEAVEAAEIGRALYRPGTRGVLNFALAGYAREHGFWTQVLEADEEALRAWIRREIPPIVMLHTGALWVDSYHFVVLTGFDDDGRIYYANTGQAGVQAVPYGEFSRRWNRSGRWGLILSPPERVDWDLNAGQFLDLALLLEKKGDFERAERGYLPALEKDPQSAAARFNLANIYLKTNRRRQAEGIYTGLLKEKPGETAVSNNLAWVYYEEGRYEEAAQVIERAFQNGAERRYDILDTAGLVSCRSGRPEKANAFFLEAISKTPPDRAALLQEIEGHKRGCGG